MNIIVICLGIFGLASTLPNRLHKRHDVIPNSVEENEQKVPGQIKSDIRKIVTKLPDNIRQKILETSSLNPLERSFDVTDNTSDTTEPAYIIGNKKRKRYRIKLKKRKKDKTKKEEELETEKPKDEEVGRVLQEQDESVESVKPLDSSMQVKNRNNYAYARSQSRNSEIHKVEQSTGQKKAKQKMKIRVTTHRTTTTTKKIKDGSYSNTTQRLGKEDDDEEPENIVTNICRALNIKPEDVWLLAKNYFGLDISISEDLIKFKNLYDEFIINLKVNGRKGEEKLTSFKELFEQSVHNVYRISGKLSDSLEVTSTAPATFENDVTESYKQEVKNYTDFSKKKLGEESFLSFSLREGHDNIDQGEDPEIHSELHVNIPHNYNPSNVSLVGTDSTRQAQVENTLEVLPTDNSVTQNPNIDGLRSHFIESSKENMGSSKPEYKARIESNNPNGEPHIETIGESRTEEIKAIETFANMTKIIHDPESYPNKIQQDEIEPTLISIEKSDKAVITELPELVTTVDKVDTGNDDTVDAAAVKILSNEQPKPLQVNTDVANEDQGSVFNIKDSNERGAFNKSNDELQIKETNSNNHSPEYNADPEENKSAPNEPYISITINKDASADKIILPININSTEYGHDPNTIANIAPLGKSGDNDPEVNFTQNVEAEKMNINELKEASLALLRVPNNIGIDEPILAEDNQTESVPEKYSSKDEQIGFSLLQPTYSDEEKSASPNVDQSLNSVEDDLVKVTNPYLAVYESIPSSDKSIVYEPPILDPEHIKLDENIPDEENEPILIPIKEIYQNKEELNPSNTELFVDEPNQQIPENVEQEEKAIAYTKEEFLTPNEQINPVIDKIISSYINQPNYFKMEDKIPEELKIVQEPSLIPNQNPGLAEIKSHANPIIIPVESQQLTPSIFEQDEKAVAKDAVFIPYEQTEPGLKEIVSAYVNQPHSFTEKEKKLYEVNKIIQKESFIPYQSQNIIGIKALGMPIVADPQQQMPEQIEQDKNALDDAKEVMYERTNPEVNEIISGYLNQPQSLKEKEELLTEVNKFMQNPRLIALQGQDITNIKSHAKPIATQHKEQSPENFEPDKKALADAKEAITPHQIPEMFNIESQYEENKVILPQLYDSHIFKQYNRIKPDENEDTIQLNEYKKQINMINLPYLKTYKLHSLPQPLNPNSESPPFYNNPFKIPSKHINYDNLQDIHKELPYHKVDYENEINDVLLHYPQLEQKKPEGDLRYFLSYEIPLIIKQIKQTNPNIDEGEAYRVLLLTFLQKYPQHESVINENIYKFSKSHEITNVNAKNQGKSVLRTNSMLPIMEPNGQKHPVQPLNIIRHNTLKEYFHPKEFNSELKSKNEYVRLLLHFLEIYPELEPAIREKLDKIKEPHIGFNKDKTGNLILRIKGIVDPILTNEYFTNQPIKSILVKQDNSNSNDMFEIPTVIENLKERDPNINAEHKYKDMFALFTKTPELKIKMQEMTSEVIEPSINTPINKLYMLIHGINSVPINDEVSYRILKNAQPNLMQSRHDLGNPYLNKNIHELSGKLLRELKKLQLESELDKSNKTNKLEKYKETSDTSDVSTENHNVKVENVPSEHTSEKPSRNEYISQVPPQELGNYNPNILYNLSPIPYQTQPGYTKNIYYPPRIPGNNVGPQYIPGQVQNIPQQFNYPVSPQQTYIPNTHVQNPNKYLVVPDYPNIPSILTIHTNNPFAYRPLWRMKGKQIVADNNLSIQLGNRNNSENLDGIAVDLNNNVSEPLEQLENVNNIHEGVLKLDSNDHVVSQPILQPNDDKLLGSNHPPHSLLRTEEASKDIAKLNAYLGPKSDEELFSESHLSLPPEIREELHSEDYENEFGSFDELGLLRNGQNDYENVQENSIPNYALGAPTSSHQNPLKVSKLAVESLLDIPTPNFQPQYQEMATNILNLTLEKFSKMLADHNVPPENIAALANKISLEMEDDVKNGKGSCPNVQLENFVQTLKMRVKEYVLQSGIVDYI